jgi:hypothetical protein
MIHCNGVARRLVVATSVTASVGPFGRLGPIVGPISTVVIVESA